MMEVSKLAVIMSGRQVGIWLGLNLLDLGLSVVALEYGRALELPMMAWLLKKVPYTAVYYQSSYICYGLWKVGLAILVPAFLARINKTHLLRWLNICMAAVCLYITIMLIRTFS